MTLNPAQQEVIDHGFLSTGFSCVLQMPTGSGKTWLSALALRGALSTGYKGVYLTPLRALAEELVERWSREFEGYKVGVFTGDYGARGRSLPVPYEKADLLIMTPERLDACIRNWRSHWAWIPQIDLVVVDEIHLVGDPGRGPRLEGTISRLRRLNPFVRFLGLSATLGNRGELADWLEGVEFASDWRPVPLRWRVSRFRKPEEKPELLCQETDSVCRKGSQSLVFVQSRRRSEVLAKYLCSQGIRAAFHHAGLSHGQRKSIEKDFRCNQTPILVATGTLEMGLNMPARQVILYDIQGYEDGQFSPLASNTVWQRAGRAGRPGLDSEGEVVLFAPTWDKRVDDYERGKFEKIKSGLCRPICLQEQILIEMQAGMGGSETQLRRSFASSLNAIQGQSLLLDDALREMLEAEIIRKDEETGSFRVTPIGKVATRQMLSPNTVLQIRELLKSGNNLTFFDLLVGAACTDDCQPILTVDFEELENLADEIAKNSSNIFGVEEELPTPLQGKRLLSSLKAATVLLQWTGGQKAEELADEFNFYPFELSRLQESMDRILTAMGCIQGILDKKNDELEDVKGEVPKSTMHKRILLLRQMVLNGLDAEVASLTFVHGVGSTWAHKLFNIKIKNLAELATANPHRLARLKGLSKERAEKWILQAGDLNKTSKISDAPAKKVTVRPAFRETKEDPYRLRRAVDLRVEQKGKDQWLVTGGLEPHKVKDSKSKDVPGLLCDCPDNKKGNTCKHILAVQLHQGDENLTLALKLMENNPPSKYLDLQQCWFSKS